MPSLKAALSGLLAAGVMLGSPPAEARFGKRSKPRSERPRPKEHAATPVGKEKDKEDRDDAPRRSRRVAHRPLAEVVVAGAIVAATPRPRAVALTTEAEKEWEDTGPVPLLVRMGVQGDLLGEAGGLGLFMAMEGRRLGFDTRMTGLAFDAEDGSDVSDRITLLSAHVTAALWASERGRLRGEAGLGSAHAPGAIFMGPSFALSVEACIGRSPVDIEARIQAVPFPHHQVDGQAGLALHLGTFNVRGGWRGLYLNDAGHVDGVEHEEVLSGPYVGMGFSF